MPFAQTTRTQRSLPRWYEWLAVVVAAILAMVYLLIQPAIDLAGRGLGSAISAVAAGATIIAEQAHHSACDAIQRDPQVAQLFGNAIECAPLEETTWYDTHGRPELEFSFAISGARGEPGEARAVVTIDNEGPRLQSLRIATPDQSILVPILR